MKNDNKLCWRVKAKKKKNKNFHPKKKTTEQEAANEKIHINFSGTFFQGRFVFVFVC
jgi:hypothetical protein